VWYIYEPYTLKFGVGKPEYRLVPGIFAAALAPAGMFIFGYAARSDITWVAPTVGLALYAGASFIVSSPLIKASSKSLHTFMGSKNISSELEYAQIKIVYCLILLRHLIDMQYFASSSDHHEAQPLISHNSL
jgi:DHA1 family multidrug resistance protein-like MFS transporter